MIDRFYILRSTTVLACLYLLLWRYALLPLDKLKIFDHFGGGVFERLLSVFLIGFLLFRIFEMCHLTSRENEEDAHSIDRQLAGLILLALVSVILSVDKVFLLWGLEAIAWWSVTLGVLLGAALALCTVLAVDTIHTSNVLRESGLPRAFYTPWSFAAGACPVFPLIGTHIFLRLVDPHSTLPHLAIVLSSAGLMYFYCKLTDVSTPDATMKAMQRLFVSCLRERELYSKIETGKITNSEGNKRRHQKVLRKIEKIRKGWRPDRILNFRFLDTVLPLENGKYIDFACIDDEVGCVEVEIENAATGNKDKVVLKASFIKKAMDEIRNIGKVDNATGKWLDKHGEFFTCMHFAYELHKTAAIPGAALLAVASKGSMAELRRAVEKESCDLNVQAEDGWTPLHHTVAAGNVEKTRYLLQKGVRTEVENRIGVTPLGYATLYGNIKLCKLLVTFGAKVNHADPKGMTPLMAASSRGHTAVVQFLLGHGANTKAKTLEEKAALDFAEESRFGEIAKLLRASETGG